MISILSTTFSLLLTLVVVAFGAAAIADTIGWRLPIVDDTTGQPAITQSQITVQHSDQL